MSTAELIAVVEALSPEKQKMVEDFVSGLVEPAEAASTVRYVGTDEARVAASRIFEENAELFKKLAQ